MDSFIIEKNGWYYRPDSAGYTGRKSEAGRYSFDDAAQIVGPNGPDGPQDGLSAWAEADAPEYSSSCGLDVKQWDKAYAAGVASVAVDMKEAARAWLDGYDRFIGGEAVPSDVHKANRDLSLAASFAAAGYEKSAAGGADVNALLRSFLLALINPNSDQLDYLRKDPAAGKVARDIAAGGAS